VTIEITPNGELIIRRTLNTDELIEKIKSIRLRGDKTRVAADAERGKHMLWGRE